MSSEELSSFCDQIALMLSSGMTLRDGIEMLAEDEQKGNDKVHPYTNLYKVVDETGSLYVAMKENEDEWPSYMIEMVDIGEQTGRLEDIMNSLSTYYQREGRIRSAAVSAITYPLVLGVMLVVIIGILLWRVLPIFRRVLASLGVDSSSSGSVLMKIGSWAGWIVLGLIGLAVSLVWSSQIPLFHSRFTCTARQLWRNSAILVILHPLRSILLTILLWAPAILFLWDTFLFFATTPAWALLYFALAFMLSFMAMKKPFNKFIRETTPEEERNAEVEA